MRKPIVHRYFLLCFAVAFFLLTACAATKPGEDFNKSTIQSIELYALNYKPGIYSSYFQQIEAATKDALVSKGYNASIGSRINRTFNFAGEFYNHVKSRSTSDAVLVLHVSRLDSCRIYDDFGQEKDVLYSFQFMYWLYENDTGKRVLMGDPFKGSKPVYRFVKHPDPRWVAVIKDSSGNVKQAYRYDNRTGMFHAEYKLDSQWERAKQEEFIDNFVRDSLANLPHCHY